MPLILIVDDDIATNEVLFELLREGGYNAYIARDGRMALEALRETQVLPSLILLDLVMPVMNGWEFRRAQLQEPRLASVPVELLSESVISKSDVPELRADGFLRKPVSVERLFELLKDVVPLS
jgi:CheY-like chemotaxis protein